VRGASARKLDVISDQTRKILCWLLQRAEAAVAQVQELNPLVSVSSLTAPVEELDAEKLKQFTLVCASSLSLDQAKALNARCREAGIAFYLADAFGFSAYMFCDLGEKCTILVKEKTGQTNEDGDAVFQHKPKELGFCTLETALGVSLKELSQRYKARRRRKAARGPGEFAMEILTALHAASRTDDVPSTAEAIAAVDAVLAEQGLDGEAAEAFAARAPAAESLVALRMGNELSPVCAVVGGIVGQELLKAISGKDEPVDNFFFFDGLSGSGVIRSIRPVEAASDPSAAAVGHETGAAQEQVSEQHVEILV